MPQVVSHLSLESSWRTALVSCFSSPLSPRISSGGLILFQQVIDNGEVNGHVNSLRYLGVPFKGHLHPLADGFSFARTFSKPLPTVSVSPEQFQNRYRRFQFCQNNFKTVTDGFSFARTISKPLLTVSVLPEQFQNRYRRF